MTHDAKKKVYFPNSYEKDILNVYYDLGISVRIVDGERLCRREECKKCVLEDKNLLMPTSIWQVGDNYFESDYKLLIVGKVARGEPGEEYYFPDGSMIIDSTGKAQKTGDDQETYFTGFEKHKDWGKAYWRYTRDLVNKLYGENGWEYIAFTNMIKCNSSYGADTTPSPRKNNCVGIIKKEIEYLKPKNILFYTNSNYDDQIKGLFDIMQSENKVTVNVGKYDMQVWNFAAELNGQIINVIRVAHPQGKRKKEYIQSIIDRLIK